MSYIFCSRAESREPERTMVTRLAMDWWFPSDFHASMHDSIPLINSACGCLLHLTGSLNHAASSLKKETTPHPNHSSRRPRLLSSLSRRLDLNLTRVHRTVAPPGGGSVEFSPIQAPAAASLPTSRPRSPRGGRGSLPPPA